MTILSRLALIAFALHAVQASAQSIQLPSVPVGGALLARVTLTSLGGPALSGVTVTLTVPANCGTFQGSPSINVVTDASGSFTFVFTPGTVPGDCIIVGRSGNVSGSATTGIYRPSDVVITGVNHNVVHEATPGLRTQSIQLLVRAGSAAVRGIAITADAPTGTGGAAPTLTAQSTLTDSLGNFVFQASFPGAPGTFDYLLHAGAVTQLFRIHEPVAATTAVPARSIIAQDDLDGVNGPTTVSIVSGAASCVIQKATRTAVESPVTPTGTMDFPLGYLSFSLRGCPALASVAMKVEYAQALPPDGVVYTNSSLAWNKTAASAVSGSTATFTVVDNGTGDTANLNADIDIGPLAVARPGVRANLAKPAVHDMWWAGAAENGWGLSMTQSADGNVFAAIYAYDDAGNPTWWVVPTVLWDYGRGSFANSLYGTYGTPWYAYDTRYMVTNKAGSAKVAFAGTGNASLDFTIDGIAGHKALQRQVFGPPDSRTVPNVNGMWWGGAAQSGWGVSIVQQNATLFLVWYTYDANNKPTWFVMPGGSWTSATTYDGRIYRTHGSPWLGRAYDPAQLQVTDVGPYRLTFNGASATLGYAIEGRTGTLALARQAPF